jgi:3-hydroxyisobutyrate dehydrogenase-like beta-hydroxyacid dehydrogenase
MKVVFIGLGGMGAPMVDRILKAGHPLELYNRDPEKAEAFKGPNVVIHKNPEEALKNADIVFTMLSDDAAVSSFINPKSIETMAPKAIHACLSTVSLDLISRLTKELGETKRFLVSCPVFGRPAAAFQGALDLCVAGDQAARLRIRKYLDPLGRIWEFGKDPRSAAAVKLAGNLMICSIIESYAECYALVEKNGVDPQSFYKAMIGSLFACPIHRLYGEIILAGNFGETGFSLNLGYKDISLVKKAADEARLPLPFANTLEERFVRALAKGWGYKDWTAISDLVREDAGLLED